MFNLYTAVILITLLTLIITVADVMTNRMIPKAKKTQTVIVCALIALAALGECIGVLTNGAPEGSLALHRAVKVVEFICAPAAGVAAAIAYGDAIRPKVAIAFALLQGLFQCVSLRFGWVFFIDTQNIYHRGELYLVYVAAFILSIIYGFAGIIRHGKRYQINFDSVLMLTLLMLVIGITIQFVDSSIRIDYLCIAVGNMMLYVRYYKTMLQVDAVTRLLNRRCYEASITDLGPQVVILFFDIDNFKHVNDTYGHFMGDICLRNIANELRNVYGKYGLCYRTGGDEFCVILQDGLEKTEELNRNFISAITRLQEENSKMPGVSIGYAYYEANISHIQSVIEEADVMLYKNKNANKAALKTKP